MLKILYFTTTVGTEYQQIPFETAGSVEFYEVLNEIAKKLNLSSQGIAVAPPGGSALVYSDYKLTVEEIIQRYGAHFSIINRGIVGGTSNAPPKNSDSVESRFFTNEAEKGILMFPNLVTQIGPDHPRWIDRVKLEIKNVSSYLRFLNQQRSQPWFFLKPCEEKKYNFVKWEGYLKVPSRPEICFDLVILLSKAYPKVFPKAFVEKRIIEYCAGNIYVSNTWEEQNKTFVMICHDHINEQSAWDPHMSIAHFFIREVWYWWNAKQNTIIRLWDEKNNL